MILEYNSDIGRLKDADEETIRKIKRQIDNSAYYSKEYAQETKKEYKKFLRTFFKWAEYETTDKDQEVPDKVSFVKLKVSEDVKDRTSAKDLAKPSDIKHLCQELDLRYQALLMTHWDLGSRINETLRTRAGDFYQRNGKWYVKVRINPKQTKDGSKSPRREARVKIASPVIRRWLEEGHPNPEDEDAYLFCAEQKEDSSWDEKDLSYEPASYSHSIGG